MVALPGASFLLGLEVPLRGFTPGIGIDHPGKMFPTLVLGENPAEPKVFMNGKTSHA